MPPRGPRTGGDRTRCVDGQGVLFGNAEQVADDAVQIFGGMGLMEEMPTQRLWRDSRLERIWDGTTKIRRHIIIRSILRPVGA